MAAKCSSLEVKLLLFAIQKTTGFEKLLAARFAVSIVQQEQEEAEVGTIPAVLRLPFVFVVNTMQCIKSLHSPYALNVHEWYALPPEIKMEEVFGLEGPVH